MSPTLLTDAQIQTLRVEWLDDFIDLRAQWGTALAGSGAKGSQSLALSGLASVGTLRAGTQIHISQNGQVNDYYLTTDALITSGAATISFTPPLTGIVVSGTKVIPEPRRRSLYNKRTGRLFFSDPDLQDYADRAMRLRGRLVRSADDPDSMFFRAIRYYAWSAMLSSDEYLNAVLANDGGGSGKILIDAKRALLAEDYGIIFTDQVGPQNVSFVR